MPDDFNLRRLIIRTAGLLLFGFFFYLLYKYHASKKIGRTNKILAWIAAIIFIVIGLAGVIIFSSILFALLQSSILNYALIVLFIIFIIFALSFILVGISLIAIAINKLKKKR